MTSVPEIDPTGPLPVEYAPKGQFTPPSAQERDTQVRILALYFPLLSRLPQNPDLDHLLSASVALITP